MCVCLCVCVFRYVLHILLKTTIPMLRVNNTSKHDDDLKDFTVYSHCVLAYYGLAVSTPGVIISLFMPGYRMFIVVS